MAKLDPQNLSVAEMMQCVARFKALRGSDEAYVDGRPPGHKRRKINLVGMGWSSVPPIRTLRPTSRFRRMASILA